MSVKRQDTGACPVCGRALSKWTTHVTLKSGEQVCRDCENVVRVKFPVTYGRKDKRYSEKRVDPLSDLTLGEFRSEMDKAVEYVEQLRKEYGFDAVFKVEKIKMEPHGWFRPPLIFAEGRTIYGFFDIKDKIKVVRRGEGVTAEIKGIDRKTGGEKDAVDWEHRAEAGYPCTMVFSQKDLMVAPGDMIVK